MKNSEKTTQKELIEKDGPELWNPFNHPIGRTIDGKLFAEKQKQVLSVLDELPTGCAKSILESLISMLDSFSTVDTKSFVVNSLESNKDHM